MAHEIRRQAVGISRSQVTEPGFDELFSCSDGLTCLELCNFEGPEQNIASYGPIVGDGGEILAKLECERYKDASERLVIFFSEWPAECTNRDQHLLRSRTPPFHAQKTTLQSIANAFSLPMMSQLQMYKDGQTMFIDYGTSLCVSGNEIQTFMIQNSFTATSQYSASFSYNPTKRIAGAFVHGLRELEIIALVDKLVTRQGSIALPMILPLLLVTFRVDSARGKVENCHREIIEIEHQTGIRTKWHPGKVCCGGVCEKQPTRRRYDSLNFDEITADLTSLTSKLAYVEYMCEMHLPMLDSFDGINKRILQICPENYKRMIKEADYYLRTESGLLRSSLQATYSKAKYLSKRGQVQVQTIYSLIAQKDNALNMKDNFALKTISEDQKRIALIATRDSAAMGVISAITTIFLPETFTATFFSTTFFDFQLGNDGPSIVSRWVWLYFVVTFVLSILIIAWWYISSSRKQYEIDGAVGGLAAEIQSRVSGRTSDEKSA